jgi:5'/3'-nucleotidase surE
MIPKRPLIFVSNDDGIDAKGLYALIDIARSFGEVIAVAPETPQSGKSSALTAEDPLRVTQMPDYNGCKTYKVNGTPVDCAKLSFHSILPRVPDMVLSGINHGANTGNSVIYSGTMGIAFEGSIQGIPSIGFSLTDFSKDADFSKAEGIIKHIITDVLKSGLPEGVCLNVNIPSGLIPEGIKIVKAAEGKWTEEYMKCVDPHNRTYYWLTGKYINLEPENPETDLYWIKRNFATVVPCIQDRTAYSSIDKIKNILS